MTNDKEKYREEFEALAGLDIHTEKWSTGSYKSSIHERSWQCYIAGRKRGEAETDNAIADVAANCRASYLAEIASKADEIEWQRKEITQLKKQLQNIRSGGMSDVKDRITNYLSSGGLFNPELMDHKKVRDLIIDCRDELIQKDAEIEQLQCWRGMYDVILRREQQLEQKLAVAVLALEFCHEVGEGRIYDLTKKVLAQLKKEDTYSENTESKDKAQSNVDNDGK